MSLDKPATPSATRAAQEIEDPAGETGPTLQQQLSERFAEIATLTRLLADAESSGGRHDWRTQWLLSVAPLLRSHMMTRGRFGWKRVDDSRLMARLKEAGLFDADAYLASNPDVRAAGADPLQHFLSHGINEGRALGI